MNVVGVMKSGAVLVEMCGKEAVIIREMAAGLKRLENGSDGVVRLKDKPTKKKHL